MYDNFSLKLLHRFERLKIANHRRVLREAKFNVDHYYRNPFLEEYRENTNFRSLYSSIAGTEGEVKSRLFGGQRLKQRKSHLFITDTIFRSGLENYMILFRTIIYHQALL